MDSQTTQALITQLLPLVGEFGFGGALFFVFGYTLKKVLKIIAMIFVFFFGLFGLGLWYANLKGWVNISVDWMKVETALISAVTWTMNGLLQVVNTAPQQGAFFSGSAVGFLAGLKKG